MTRIMMMGMMFMMTITLPNVYDDDNEITTILSATLTQMLAKTDVKEKEEENSDNSVLN